MSYSKTPRKTRSPYQIQVLDRALALLDVLSQNGPDLTLVQISESLGLHKSTAHRLIMVLERHRLIERHSGNSKYRLGLKLFELGTRAVSQLDLRERARPFLEQVVAAISETVHLCIYDSGEVVYLDKVEPARSVRLASSVGRRNPAHCTAVGKAIMAFLPQSQVEAGVQKHGFRKLTRNSLSTKMELNADLARVRQRGYAVDNEENEEGVCCVGAVVRDYTGEPVAAISASGPTFRISHDKIPLVAQSVMAAANSLSRELGFKLDQVKQKDGLRTVKGQAVNA